MARSASVNIPTLEELESLFIGEDDPSFYGREMTNRPEMSTASSLGGVEVEGKSTEEVFDEMIEILKGQVKKVDYESLLDKPEFDWIPSYSVLNGTIHKVESKDGPYTPFVGRVVGDLLKNSHKLSKISLCTKPDQRAGILGAGVEHIGDSLLNNKGLRHLELVGQLPGSAGWKALGRGLELCWLETLIVSENEALVSEESIKVFGQGLKFCEQLTKLDLGNNRFTTKQMDSILAGLEEAQSQLVYLDVSRNSIGFEGAKSLAVALNRCGMKIKMMKALLMTSLEHLDLSFVPMDVHGTDALVGALNKNSFFLKNINLQGVGLGDNAASQIISIISKCFALRKIDLSENAIRGVECIRSLGVALAGSRLQSLSFTAGDDDVLKNELPPDGMSGLLSGIAKARHLTEIDLSQNQFTAESAEELENAIRQCGTLAVVKLRDVFGAVEDETAVARVLNALATHPAVRCVDVSRNVVDPKLFAKVLVRGAAWEELDLSFCRGIVTDEVAESFVSLFRVDPPCLRKLNLANTNMDDLAFGVICEAMSKNRMLSSIDISNNPLTDTGVKGLFRSLYDNVALKQVTMLGIEMTEEVAGTAWATLNHNYMLETLAVDDELGPLFGKLPPRLRNQPNTAVLRYLRDKTRIDFEHSVAAVASNIPSLAGSHATTPTQTPGVSEGYGEL